jgi:hypothetical protein
MIGTVKDQFQDHPFLWQANKSVGDGVFGPHAQRLPNVPHGLNDYSDYDRIAFLSAVNTKTDHFRFLASRGVDADAVRRAIYGSAVYQSVMRTSIRIPESDTRKTIIVKRRERQNADWKTSSQCVICGWTSIMVICKPKR